MEELRTFPTVSADILNVSRSCCRRVWGVEGDVVAVLLKRTKRLRREVEAGREKGRELRLYLFSFAAYRRHGAEPWVENPTTPRQPLIAGQSMKAPL